MSTDYRYTLSRVLTDQIELSPKTVLFVMLNPSSADETTDDPTIRRCMSFARREGGTRLEVVNLFAQRATKPKHLRAPTRDEIHENWLAVGAATTRADLIIAGWGAHPQAGTTPIRGRLVYRVHRYYGTLYCLGKTADGSPKHPLYIRADTPLEVWP